MDKCLIKQIAYVYIDLDSCLKKFTIFKFMALCIRLKDCILRLKGYI